MQNTKLIELLRTFKEKEIFGLEELISSKFFNKNENAVTLFTAIKKYYPDFLHTDFTKENIYQIVFGKKKYDDEKMRTLISVLMKLAKKYLVQLELENKTQYANLFLLEQLRVRDQENLFDYELGKADKHLEENLYKEGDYYYARYLTDFTNFYGHPSGFKDSDEESNLLNKISLSLERFVFLEAMDINYQMLTRKFKMNFKPNYIFLEQIKYKIQNNDYSDAPLIPLKYYAFSAIDNHGREDYFEACQKLYFESFEKISEFERGSIHLALVNYCMLGISGGDEKYIEKAVVLYKFALQHGLYFYNNKYLLPYMFYNIVKFSVHIGDTKWTFNFIFEYKNKVPPEFRKDVVNASYGKYYFEIGEFDSALKHVNKINPHNAPLKLEVLTLLVKIFYELDYVENIYSAVDSLRHFIKSSKTLSPSLANQAKHFAMYTRKIMDLKGKFNKKELEYLKKEISSIKEFGLINQKWILKKIEAITK